MYVRARWCGAGLLVVPVGGGPPASRPCRELRSARRLEARPGPAAAHRHRSLALRFRRRPPVRPATLVKPSSLLLACALSPVKPTTPLHARYTCFAAISSSKGVMGFTQARRGPRIGVDGFISRRGKRYGRDKVRPAPTVDGDSVKIFAQRGQNGPKWTFYGVLGEFFRGNGAHGLVLGEFFAPTGTVTRPRSPPSTLKPGRPLRHCPLYRRSWPCTRIGYCDMDRL